MERITDKEGIPKTILFNLSELNHLGLISFAKYFQNNLPYHDVTCAEIEDIISKTELSV